MLTRWSADEKIWLVLLATAMCASLAARWWAPLRTSPWARCRENTRLADGLAALRILTGLGLCVLLLGAGGGCEGSRFERLLLTMAGLLGATRLQPRRGPASGRLLPRVSAQLNVWIGCLLAVWAVGFALLGLESRLAAESGACQNRGHAPSLLAPILMWVTIRVHGWVDGRAELWTPRALRRRLLQAVRVGLLLVALGGVASAWISARTAAHCHRGVAAAPTRTVAIVPGALMYPGGVPSVTLRDRLATARDLYGLGKVRRILISGGHSRADYDEVNPSRRWLMSQGIPSEDIFLDHAGFRTLDTMIRARRVFQVSDARGHPGYCTRRQSLNFGSWAMPFRMAFMAIVQLFTSEGRVAGFWAILRKAFSDCRMAFLVAPWAWAGIFAV